MFQASSVHLQEDIVVYMQHMVLSLSIRVPGGLSMRSESENSQFMMHGQKNINLCVVFEWTVFASDWPTQWDDVAQK